MFTRFKELREDLDLKQFEIAKILGVTQAQYSFIENNKSNTDYIGLLKLALFYNVSVDYILGITDVSKPYLRSSRNNILF